MKNNTYHQKSNIKLLIFTQKVDINDDLLGFFHDWLEELAKNIEKVYVVALYVGQYNLPDNVKVFSLGKERKPSKLKYLWNFYKYIWKLRKQYDSVFVHMNTEYVNLGGWFWRLMKKKIVLWYTHYKVDWRLKLAAFWADKIVTSTASSCNLKNKKKLQIIGHGINLEKFQSQNSNIKTLRANEFHILYLGRISKIKNLDMLINAFSKLVKDSSSNIQLFLDIVGAPTPVDTDYFQEIKKQTDALSGRVKFWGKIPNYKTVDFYNQADLCVNLTPTGSFDKTILEAMACQTPTLVSNKAFYEYFNKELQELMIFEENNKEDLIKKIRRFISLTKEEQRRIGKKQREVVAKYHSLDNLIKRIINVFEKIS